MAKKDRNTTETDALAPAIPTGEDGYPLTECRQCRSTNRTPFTETSCLLLDGKVHRWFRTQCSDCGQIRVERLVETAPGVADAR
jgi:hypothetical protein